MDDIKQRRNELFHEFKTEHKLKPDVLFIIYRLLSISCGLNQDTYTNSMTDSIMNTVGLNELSVNQRDHVRNMCHVFRDQFKEKVHVRVDGYTITYAPKSLQETTIE
jgi:hypothetical protein